MQAEEILLALVLIAFFWRRTFGWAAVHPKLTMIVVCIFMLGTCT